MRTLDGLFQEALITGDAREKELATRLLARVRTIAKLSHDMSSTLLHTLDLEPEVTDKILGFGSMMQALMDNPLTDLETLVSGE